MGNFHYVFDHFCFIFADSGEIGRAAVSYRVSDKKLTESGRSPGFDGLMHFTLGREYNFAFKISIYGDRGKFGLFIYLRFCI